MFLAAKAYAMPPESDPDMTAFSKWQHVLPALQEPEAKSTHRLTLAELKKIHTRINKVKYSEDFKAYNAFDYWATPEEFYEKGGDCEDYAIAKYGELLKRGVPDKDMLLIIAVMKKTRQPHALLQVTLRGKTYLLDNRSNILYSRGYLKQFTPWYGINRLGWVRQV